MAKTSKSPSTPASDEDDEWPLLREVLALTASYCGESPEAAEQLIIEAAQDGWFPHYRYYHRDCGANHQAIDPRHWGRSARNVRYPVSFETSSVDCIREEAKLGSLDELLEELLADESSFAGRSTQMRLVRLPRRDVLAMLERVGLLPVALAPAPPDEQAAAKPKKSKRRRPQYDRALAVLRHLHPDGQIIVGSNVLSDSPVCCSFRATPSEIQLMR
jgi:hypothetical protein